MIKYICKKCNINTETSVCPVCGERAEMESSSIYWCDTCNIPLYDEICPMCGKTAHRIGSDLRPVFPEERLLLEIMIGEPFKYKNSSVWNAAGNYYYVDGKKLTFSVKQTKLLNAKMIRKQLDELSDQNSYDFFDKNIGKFLIANRHRYNYISNEAMEYIRTMAEGVSLTEMFVSFSGGKDSTVVSDLVLRALGTQQVLHLYGDTTLENDAYMHILEELAFLPPAHIGTEIRNFKQILAAERRGIEQFYPLAEQQYKEIQQKRTKIADMEDQIARIDNSIFGKENMSSYEADLNRIKENVKAFQETKASCNQQIGASKSAIESAQKVYDGLVTASERNQKLITYLAYAEKICTWIDESYAEREQQMRNRLQERVNEIFSQMYHGQRRVQIDKQYHVTLFSQVKGKEVITGESEGLKRVKNFAFIAGLVDLAKEKATIGQRAAEAVSWENEAYPLVMDAPFSNADETHIKNISTVLPTVANQVIMFVMEKDWQYAEPVMAGRVGKYCKLKKFSESYTQIEK